MTSTKSGSDNGAAGKIREINGPKDAQALLAELKLFRERNEKLQMENEVLQTELKKLRLLINRSKRKIAFAEAVEQVVNDVAARNHAKKTGIEHFEI
jgi:hypothetical protein